MTRLYWCKSWFWLSYIHYRTVLALQHYTPKQQAQPHDNTHTHTPQNQTLTFIVFFLGALLLPFFLGLVGDWGGLLFLPKVPFLGVSGSTSASSWQRGKQCWGTGNNKHTQCESRPCGHHLRRGCLISQDSYTSQGFESEFSRTRNLPNTSLH